MGSSVGEARDKEFNPSAGDLVWVRQNNGSWWPGRVVGPDELSEISAVPRRTGTPVMLLGRKNINIDWYNIPKSKRVKAFRCGEYNHCIEKAKASAAIPNKKKVNYPRREDAILLALKLESAELGKDQPNFYTGSYSAGETNATSHDRVSESDENSHSALELSQSGISFEEPNQTNSPQVETLLGGNGQNSGGSEDDGLEEGSKRMKGLEDLGMSSVTDKMISSTIVDCSTSTIPANMVKRCSSFLKRKRTQVARVQELLKRKKRCRQLTKVMENANMVSVPVLCNELPHSSCPAHDGVSSSNLPTSVSVASKRISASARKTNVDGNGIHCQNGITVNIAGEGCSAVNGLKNEHENDASCLRDLQENESFDGLYDVPLAGEIGLLQVSKSGSSGARNRMVNDSQKFGIAKSAPLQQHWNLGDAVCINNLSRRMKKGTSKWQAKRKRNSRSFNKGKSRNSRKSISRVAMDKMGAVTHLGGQAAGSSDLNSRFDSSLYNVELELQATYHPEHVPFVSLRSRLNGKTIVGHPIAIEVLRDGYCDFSMGIFMSKRSNSKRSRFFLGKPHKGKKSGLLSKKMRKLSSFNNQKQSEVDGKIVVDNTKGSVIACIPMKVVFSRINEAVNGFARPVCRVPSQN